MKLRCAVCEHVQEGEHLAVACEGCGARQTMKFAPTGATLKPGEPIVGPSKVPITREPLSQVRGADQEPLEVTRERTRVFQRLTREGAPVGVARTLSEREVPVQCGRCGGSDPRCTTCRGRATAPTAALAEVRRPKRKPRSARKHSPR